MALTKVSSKTLSDNAVTSDKIAAGAISVSDMADNSITAAKLHTSVQGALGTRNLIINGDMRIAQRGTSASSLTGSAYNTIDRMYTSISNGGTWTQSQDTDVPTGQGFAHSLKMNCTTADASLATTDRVRIEQYIEAQMLQHIANGTANAKSLTVSFWVKSNKTGTYNVSFYKFDNTARAVGKTYTIDTADTWEKKTITFDGDTSGGGIDNNNERGLTIYFWLASGPDYTSGTFSNGTWENYVAGNWVSSSQVNLADNTANYINITGVQLEVGDTATPFEHRPYDMELVRCQRYFQRLPENVEYLTSFYFDNTSRYCTTVYFPVIMRTSSQTIEYGTAEYRNGSTYTNGTYLNNSRRNNLITIRITCPSAPDSGGYALGLKLLGTWTLDAEL